MIEKHLEMLGLKAEDKVTGFTGIVSTIGFDLYGCIQGWLTPIMDKDGKTPEGQWFDVTRLRLLAEKSVMPVPDFSKGYISEGNKGCSFKSNPH